MQQRQTRWRPILLAAAMLVAALLACGTTEQQDALKTRAAEVAETAAAAAKGAGATEAAEAKATALSAVATELAKAVPSPWKVSWVPDDTERVIAHVDRILKDTGMPGEGRTLLESALEKEVNPAFALAMFRKEATFAAPGTLAHVNNNPGNIVATGECRGLPAGSSCTGVYGEVGTDGRFGVYATMSDGVVAYFRLLSAEYRPGAPRNCSDIPCIIEQYCPPSECDTQGYVTQITGWTAQYQVELLLP